jgi:hypothetical protein
LLKLIVVPKLLVLPKMLNVIVLLKLLLPSLIERNVNDSQSPSLAGMLAPMLQLARRKADEAATRGLLARVDAALGTYGVLGDRVITVCYVEPRHSDWCTRWIVS